MALIDQLRDDDPGAKLGEAGSKGTSPAQSPKNSGPAGKAHVGKSGMPKKDGSKDTVSPKSTKRGQTKVGSSSGIKPPASPKNVTAKNTKRGK